MALIFLVVNTCIVRCHVTINKPVNGHAFAGKMAYIYNNLLS